MIRYSIHHVTEGMVLARSIILPTGELMLAAGEVLKPSYISRLKYLGIDVVYVEVPGTEDINPKSIISNQIQREMASRLVTGAKNLQLMFKMKVYSQVQIHNLIEENKNELNDFIANTNFMQCINNVIDEILEYPEVIVNLASLEKQASFLFEHALRVTIMSLCIAKRYKFSKEEMKQLALGAINSDIGLIAVPKEIVTNERKLTAEELILFQKHVDYGNMILSQNPAIPATSASVAYQHHECQDGSGYPQGLRGDNAPPKKSLMKDRCIHRFAEIVAVADKFDILIEGRSPYGYKISRKEAMKILFLCADSKLNSNIVFNFSKIIPIYPVGTRIKITKAYAARYIGCFGAVVEDTVEDLGRPKVVIYESKYRRRMKPFIIDLIESQDIEVEAVL